MSSTIVNICYPIENYLKLIFIPMAIMNMTGTVLIAFIVTIMALLRVTKTPQFNKQYAQKVVLNNHGQNLFYLGLGAMGNVNFLYYAPLILFFAFGFAQFINQKFPQTKYSQKYMPYINMIRNQKFYIMQGKSKIEFIYFVYLLISLPFDFMGKIIKLFLMGQYLLLKYRITNQCKYAASQIHNFIDQKTKIVGIVNKIYNKIVDYVYQYANQDPRGQQHQQ